MTAPAFLLEPAATLLDEPVRIRVVGAPPGATVRMTLRAETFGAEAAAVFASDETGVVDVGAATPLGGDYEGVDPMGLFWAARFDAGIGFHSMVVALAELEPVRYTLRADIDGVPVAPMAFVRRVQGYGVMRSAVREGRLRGTFFSPAGATSCPGVLVVGGSDGGNNFQYVAALLAARGFAALALGYFALEDLPAELVEIPLEYFVTGIEWLRRRPEVGGRRIGVLGPSRGGELALLLGATVPEIAAVVALVPSGLTGGGVGAGPAAMGRAAWTLAGKPFHFVPPRFDAEAMRAFGAAMATGAPVAMTPGFQRLLDAAAEAELDASTIPVERTSGPILMMSAGDDQIWPSTRLAEIAIARLRANALGYPVEHLSYPRAGHMSCLPPYLPTTRTWSRHPLVPLALEMGGTPEANARASADAWPRIVSFLRQHLR